MTSEDYMGTREWDHEIEIIIQDMRDKLYDLKEKDYTYVLYSDGTISVEDVDE
jgi:hypothetical protein